MNALRIFLTIFIIIISIVDCSRGGSPNWFLYFLAWAFVLFQELVDLGESK